jgi:hypothetical protein
MTMADRMKYLGRLLAQIYIAQAAFGFAVGLIVPWLLK